MCLNLSANWRARHSKDIADSINEPNLTPFVLDPSQVLGLQPSILNAPRNNFISVLMFAAMEVS
jgi:hypothetical protein